MGLEVSQEADEIVVIAPMADSPAERAGILAGDRIVAMDGAPTREMPVGEATRRMKGPAGHQGGAGDRCGTGFSAPQELHAGARPHPDAERGLARARPERRHVYVRVRAFQDRTDRELRKALDEARKEIGGPIQGLVLDLRNDPGGLLDQAVKVADRFLSRASSSPPRRAGKQP